LVKNEGNEYKSSLKSRLKKEWNGFRIVEPPSSKRSFSIHYMRENIFESWRYQCAPIFLANERYQHH